MCLCNCVFTSCIARKHTGVVWLKASVYKVVFGCTGLRHETSSPLSSLRSQMDDSLGQIISSPYPSAAPPQPLTWPLRQTTAIRVQWHLLRGFCTHALLIYFWKDPPVRKCRTNFWIWTNSCVCLSINSNTMLMYVCNVDTNDPEPTHTEKLVKEKMLE